jgi:serine protease Do
MLPKIQNQLKSFVIISALLSATFPVTPANSQTINISPQPLPTNFTNFIQSEKLTQANLVAEDVKSSVVRVVTGCKAKVYSPNTGRRYSQAVTRGKVSPRSIAV